MTVHFNPYLESLNGLDNLVCIGGDLIFEVNEVLYDLDGPENLMTIVNEGCRIQIESNNSLTDINASGTLTLIPSEP